MSAQAVVARRIGEDRREAAGSAALHAALVAVAASIGIGVAGVVFAEPLLRLMGATDAVVAVGVPYFSVLVGSNVTITLLFLLNGVLRGTGDASLAMRALWLANLLNVVLDPLFIFGLGPIPALGVTGAAVATAVGRSLGIAFQLWVMTRGRSRLRRPAGGLRMEMALVVRLLRIAGPGMVQFLIGASSFILLMRIVALFGSDAVAGYTIAFRVIIFILLPAWGIANATATLTGQNLGAGRPDRAERFVGLCTRFATLVLSVAGMLLFLAASPVVRAFTDSPEAIRAGVSCLRIVALTFPLRGATLTLVQAFNGAGDTVTPSWINFLAYWLVQIPVALTLAYVLDLGLDGVFAGIAVANGAAALVAWRLFRRGRWKLREV